MMTYIINHSKYLLLTLMLITFPWQELGIEFTDLDNYLKRIFYLEEGCTHCLFPVF